MTSVITKTQSYPAFKWGFFWGDEEPLFSGQVAQNVENSSLPPVSNSQLNTPSISFKLLALFFIIHKLPLFINYIIPLYVHLNIHTKQIDDII